MYKSAAPLVTWVDLHFEVSVQVERTRGSSRAFPWMHQRHAAADYTFASLTSHHAYDGAYHDGLDPKCTRFSLLLNLHLHVFGYLGAKDTQGCKGVSCTYSYPCTRRWP